MYGKSRNCDLTLGTQALPDVFKPMMFLVLGDHEPPRHGIWGDAEGWKSVVPQPMQWNTKLLRLSWLNLGSSSLIM